MNNFSVLGDEIRLSFFSLNDYFTSFISGSHTSRINMYSYQIYLYIKLNSDFWFSKLNYVAKFNSAKRTFLCASCYFNKSALAPVKNDVKNISELN